ncbi:MAG: hypothetical protein NVSMB19_15790 [Vulcanimicrobiaceae bacterium]
MILDNYPRRFAPGFRRAVGFNDSPVSEMTNAPSTAPTPIATANATPLGYDSILSGANTGGLSWRRFRDFVTHDAVFSAQLADGRTVYAGPSNQAYVGRSTDFYYGNPGSVNPMSGAIATTWAALFPHSGPTTNFFNTSNYTGPGAASAQADQADATRIATPLGEAINPSVRRDPTGLGAVVGAVGAAIGLLPPRPPAAAASVGLATSGSSVVGNTSGVSASANPAIIGNTTAPGPVSQIAGLPAVLADALKSALAGGGGGFVSQDMAAGVPSTAGIVAGNTAALDALQPAAVPSSSAGNPSLPIALLGVVAIGGFIAYERLHKSSKNHPKKKGG